MLRRRFSVFLVLLLTIMAGCTRGPGPQELEPELQNRLDGRFREGLFAVSEFRRTGSAPFRDIEAGVSGVHVYYDAQLELLQDYSLTDWSELNVSTLAFAIGANESGISGFHSSGNRRGDLLQVHGRISYGQGEQGEWRTVERAPERGGKRAGEVSGLAPEDLLADARALMASEVRPAGDQRRAVIVEEMARAVNDIDLRVARLEDRITLGSGPAQGTYRAFGEAFSRFANKQGVPFYSALSEGSVENASRLQAGLLDFGLVQSDVAQIFYQGLSERGLLPNRELRAVASLWPEAIHLLTLESTGIRSLRDLRGRRVAIGRRGSGSRINAIIIGLATAPSPEDMPTIVEIGLGESIRQLEAGELDALFLTEAVPAPSVQALAARRDDLHIVPITSTLQQDLTERDLSYYPLTLAARTYPGQTEAVTTLGLTAALLTHSRVADKRVEQVLELLFTGGDALARDYYRAAFISRETASLRLAVPLHPAAERYYQRMERPAPEKSSALE